VSVIVLLFFIFLVFGIFGVSFFSGILHTRSATRLPLPLTAVSALCTLLTWHTSILSECRCRLTPFPVLRTWDGSLDNVTQYRCLLPQLSQRSHPGSCQVDLYAAIACPVCQLFQPP
jgi:hypothetical protein